MANSNTIAAYYGGTGRNKLLAQTLATQTETEIQLGNDASASQIAVISVPTQTQILGSQTPYDQACNPATLNSGFNRLGYFGDSNPPFNAQLFDNCKPILIRYCGTYTPLNSSSSVSIALKLYLGTSKSGTNIASTGTIANTVTTGVTYGFIMEAQLRWDSTSTAVRGQFWFDISSNSTNSTYGTWAALTTETGTAAAVANLQFCASTTWGGTNGGTVTPSEFSISQL